MSKTLENLQLSARQQVYTLLIGNNLSSLHGEGNDFSGLREYQAGDDIRKISWMISAKLGVPYIKESQTHKEVSIVVAALMDGSLYFAKGNAKQKKLTEIAAILGYACEHQGDLFTGFCYTQDRHIVIPPTKQLYAIHQFSKTLFEMPLLHTTLDTDASMKNLFQSVQKPSLIFVLGDFLEEVDLSLLAQKHEIISIIIRDKEEESLKIQGEVTLTSPQNTTQVKTYLGKRNIEKYLINLQQHDEKIIKHFSSCGIRHVKIFTNDDIVKKLLSLFS